MSFKSAVIDTCFLCCYLNIAGHEVCSGNITCNQTSAVNEVNNLIQQGYNILLPFNIICEIGNIIQHMPSGYNKRQAAQALQEFVNNCEQDNSSFGIFDQYKSLDPNMMSQVLSNWANDTLHLLTLNDYLVKLVYDNQIALGMECKVLTCDEQLAAYCQ